jgi:hypothetical protein
MGEMLMKIPTCYKEKAQLVPAFAPSPTLQNSSWIHHSDRAGQRRSATTAPEKRDHKKNAL